MRKERTFNYYEAYSKQVDYALELACNLQHAVSSGDFGTRELMDALHTIENDADHACHEVHAHLLTDFVVPFERGSMSSLANAIDDVSDAVEDVAIQAYYFHCTAMEPAGAQALAHVVPAIESLRSAILLLKTLSSKKDEFRGYLVDAQDKESECDGIYINALHELYGRTDMDAEQRRIAHAILFAVEKAADAVEAVAEQLESVMAENG